MVLPRVACGLWRGPIVASVGPVEGKGKISVRVDPEIADLVPRYLELRHEDLAQLRAALAAATWEEIRRIGHSMKGTGAAYGFPRLGELGAALSTAARHQDGGAIEQLVGELEDYLARVEPVYDEG